MTEESDSVGIVKTEVVCLDFPEGGFRLDDGGSLPEIEVAYETYGTLTEAKDNVVYICHALTGNAHAAGRHDPPDPEEPDAWWEEMVGPGKGIDTNHYFVICANILGGCKGTTGPSSINPVTGSPYGSAFPNVSAGDIVGVHVQLLKQLKIDRVAAAVGGSFGGMQVIEWVIRFPDTIDHGIVIAAAVCLSAQGIAFDIVGRAAIMSDPDWKGGDYYGSGSAPDRGLALARSVGHITYLSREIMADKFGREKWHAGQAEVVPESRVDKFHVETYLEHQGEKFTRRFDANSYLHITRAMDEYDVASQYGDLETAFERVQAKVLIVAVSSDWLFPPEQSEELANALLAARTRVSYCLLNAPHGHDAFLVDVEYLSEVIRGFLPWVGRIPQSRRMVLKNKSQSDESDDRRDLHKISHLIEPGSRVLDLGCGNGELLTRLAEDSAVKGVGVDIDIHHVIRVIERGHDIFQADIDSGLSMIPDGAYDYAILSETLQTVRKPHLVLNEMLRVAKEGLVSFPNFGYWRNRLRLSVSGRIPASSSDAEQWYETENIHLFTYKDFISLCRQDNIKVVDTVCLTSGILGRIFVAAGFRNLGADLVLLRVTRAS